MTSPGRLLWLILYIYVNVGGHFWFEWQVIAVHVKRKNLKTVIHDTQPHNEEIIKNNTEVNWYIIVIKYVI